MTRLEQRKSRLVFVTADMIRERRKLREVVIEAQPRYAQVRLAGLRKSYLISYAAIYSAAVKLAVRQERAEKLARKKAA
jgi:hypothetical protein